MSKKFKQLRKKNNEREEEIFEENDEIYTNMIVYLKSADISRYHQEQIREDLIDLILEGQQRGDNIKQVMGNRYKEICDEILKVMPRRTVKERVLESLECSLSCICILGLIHLISQLAIILGKGLSEYTFVLTAGNIISMVMILLVANFTVTFICRNAFTEEKSKPNKLVALKTGTIAFIILAVIIFSNIYFTIPIITIHMILAAIFIAVLFVTERFVSEIA